MLILLWKFLTTSMLILLWKFLSTSMLILLWKFLTTSMLILLKSFWPHQCWSYLKVSDHINVDLTVILGTSNWSADYFIDTGGIGLVVNQNKTQADVRQQVEDIFLRDWHSNYSTNIWDFHFRRHETFHSEL